MLFSVMLLGETYVATETWGVLTSLLDDTRWKYFERMMEREAVWDVPTDKSIEPTLTKKYFNLQEHISTYKNIFQLTRKYFNMQEHISKVSLVKYVSDAGLMER